MRISFFSISFFTALLMSGIALDDLQANETVPNPVSDQNGLATELSEEEKQSARERDRATLTSPTELSQTVRSLLGLPNSDIIPEGFGTGSHPFTTSRAGAEGSNSPVNLKPWSAAGKLYMKFGNQTGVCTAFVIGKNLLGTAAHCVHEFGGLDKGFADVVVYEPALHLDDRPFGTWTAKRWYIPRSYYDGSDLCLPQAPGVVCENDVATVVLEPLEGQAIADLTGKFEVNEIGDDGVSEYGYVHFNGQMSAEFTQLGYPSRNYDGLQMIRTDSLGYMDEPNNVVIGSGQTGGSSGGPWVQNFGAETSFSGPEASDDDKNVVSAATSWGYTSGSVKVQGASRFGKNTTFTQRSNIRALMEDACADYPEAC